LFFSKKTVELTSQDAADSRLAADKAPLWRVVSKTRQEELT
jgi:hypothetical protein